MSAHQPSVAQSEPSEFSHYFAPQVGAKVQAKAPVAMHCAGMTMQLSTGSGVFAKAGLDAGTQILLEAFFAAHPEPIATQKLCDLGCGWGAVGCFLSKRYPSAQIAMCDINYRAVQLSLKNLGHNSIANARVWCGDGLKAAQSKYFERILCNPPVRAGNAAIEALFLEAQRTLAVNGELWIVLRTQQGAKSWQKRLKEQFGNCDTVVIERGYRVLRSKNLK
jgi:16S rRNA (guanine1207-N2)-methyltransferase